MKYRVYIDANPRRMDTTQRSQYGEYDSAGEALAAAREVVDARLQEEHRPGMRAEDLLERYARRGEAPYIMPLDEHTVFDANEYARERAARLCWRESLR